MKQIVFAVLIMFFGASPAHSEDMERCEFAIQALEANLIPASKELLRQYVLESYQTGRSDARCGESFLIQLKNAWIQQLNTDFSNRCNDLLAIAERGAPDTVVALDLIEARILSMDAQLSAKNRQCRESLQTRVSGLYWLQQSHPELAEILENCHQVQEVLANPVSQIRLAQANMLIRVSDLALTMEKEAQLPPGTSNWVKKLYQFRLSEVTACLSEATRQLKTYQK